MFLFAGSEIITVKVENINDSKTNRLIAYGILSQKPQVSNGFSFNTGRDIWMISTEIGVDNLAGWQCGCQGCVPSLPSSSPGHWLWAQQVPAVPGGINSHCRSLLWAPPWLPGCSDPAVLQLQCCSISTGTFCTPRQTLNWPAWHTNPFYTEYPYTQTILQL